MTIEIREPNEKEIEEAKKIIEEGYYQTSRKHREVARLPKGMTGKEALKTVTPESRHYWVDGLRESGAGESYLRCYAKPEDRLTLSMATFKAFRKQGGDTYAAKHWMADEEHLIKLPLCEAIAGALGPSRSYRIHLHDNCENCKHYFGLWVAKQEKASEHHG